MKSHSQIIEALVILEQELFTGITTIITPNNKQWKIYLYQGMLLWVEGGDHIYRFWQRHLNIICPHANIHLFERERVISDSISDYYFINTLLKHKLTTRKQIKYLIKQRIETIIFDIFQAENKYQLEIKSQKKSAHNLLKQHFNFTLSPLEISQSLSIIYGQWSRWMGKGLASCSPNLAPKLKQDTKIGNQVSPIILQNMKRMLSGKNTLRDLALQMNQDIFDVTCALVPYFFKGYIRLGEIPDLPGVNLPLLVQTNNLDIKTGVGKKVKKSKILP